MQAFELLKDENEIFILGGEQVFRQTIALASRIYLTVIHTVIEGDTFFPDIDQERWEKESLQFNSRDSSNPYDYTFITYRRKN